jgi:hypothetical protein
MIVYRGVVLTDVEPFRWYTANGGSEPRNNRFVTSTQYAGLDLYMGATLDHSSINTVIQLGRSGLISPHRAVKTRGIKQKQGIAIPQHLLKYPIIEKATHIYAYKDLSGETTFVHCQIKKPQELYSVTLNIYWKEDFPEQLDRLLKAIK